ncbi:hypothetical protein ElyMa_004373100 [Elysia marginata]|uniref:Uncharacterized protein n=1 Tax=Elysia marginata TaxID=1093978 RepID=A0AAV4H608_9GAST|nr:hypothetical protein ElyMa_004373100 [Elysia marginata]
MMLFTPTAWHHFEPRTARAAHSVFQRWIVFLMATLALPVSFTSAALPSTTPVLPWVNNNVRPTARARIIHDFEDPNDHSWATVNNLTSFYRQRADQHINDMFHPRVDVTTGTSQGYYGYAFYDANATNHYSPLYSSCQKPSGPECRLDFYAVIHARATVHVATVLRCAECTHVPRARARFWSEHHVGSTTFLAQGQ